MTTIKPIETIYNGYRFRSRLEARWAVFFDALGVPYEYEPEGLCINGINYLPDFYLPDCKQFFEVKGIMSDEDKEKINALINAGYSVTVGYNNGEFIACDYWEDVWDPSQYMEDHKTFFEQTEGESLLCRCPHCGKYWFMGSMGIWTCQCCGTYCGKDFDRVLGGQAGTSARDVARQARFEHGETPAAK